MDRKAQGNMWWIIIGAVIALVVMIILLVMFTDKNETLNTGLLDCISKGGKCISENECITEEGTISKAFDCKLGVCCFGSND